METPLNRSRRTIFILAVAVCFMATSLFTSAVVLWDVNQRMQERTAFEQRMEFLGCLVNAAVGVKEFGEDKICSKYKNWIENYTNVRPK